MKRVWISFIVLIVFSSVCFAEDFLTASGNVHLRGVVPFHSGSATEYPSLTGRLKVDTTHPTWRMHMWLEGGWDGTVDTPADNNSILKDWSSVYQSNTPFLEMKELYSAYTSQWLEVRAGIQRFSWGRLDEYPVNDLLNPWDYTQFLRKPLEDRKIGVPAVSARLTKNAWNMEAAWLPIFVPYRLPKLSERWAGTTEISAWQDQYNFKIDHREPDYPSRSIDNSSVGLRLQNAGVVDWGITFFHGYDPRPVFKTTELVVSLTPSGLHVDPGFVPDFHKITSIGVDAAAVKGNLSLRAEAAYARGRVFNTKYELWGYPANPGLGTYPLNPDIEHTSDTIEYGIGADYRLFEDCILTMQAQQTYMMDRIDTLFDRQFETILWANLKNGFMNQKIETNLNVAYNPEHNDTMAKANAWYTLTDHWKVGLTVVGFWGPSQSLFGRYSRNDQVELDLVFSW